MLCFKKSIHAFKTMRGEWQCETVLSLGMCDKGERILTLSTSKAMRGGVYSSAHVSHVQADGCTIWEIFGDWEGRTPVVACARVTEKVIRQAHIIAMEGLAEMEAKARAFYAAREQVKRNVAAIEREEDDKAAARDVQREAQAIAASA